ncbi:peroxisomal biogenesis factor 11-domain-containing protein [Phycomyces nitens]|nr:peroxisomal biogenesis factor 11-domain-containing protein [Phycomyces nitens]
MSNTKLHPFNSPIDALPTPTSSPPPQPALPLRSPSFMALCVPDKPPSKPLGAIVQKMLQDLDGRDKTIKIIQYFLKMLVHYHFLQSKRWSPLTSQFSMTRKILRLGHVIGPIRELLESKTPLKTIELVNGVVQELADDLYCLFKLGIVPSRIGKRAEIIAYYCWFAAILADTRSGLKSLARMQAKQVSQEELAEHNQKLHMAKVSFAKLMLDGVFCACDIWQPEFGSTVQVWAGLCSGSLSGYKLWHKFSA